MPLLNNKDTKYCNRLKRLILPEINTPREFSPFVNDTLGVDGKSNRDVACAPKETATSQPQARGGPPEYQLLPIYAATEFRRTTSEYELLRQVNLQPCHYFTNITYFFHIQSNPTFVSTSSDSQLRLRNNHVCVRVPNHPILTPLASITSLALCLTRCLPIPHMR